MFPTIELNPTDQAIRGMFRDSAWIVGGRTRDEFFRAQNGTAIVSKDNDYVVTGWSYDRIVATLRRHDWRCDVVGANFAVVKARQGNFEADIAIARRENSVGVGHKDFTIDAGPHVPIEDDVMRRDITWNAVAYNLRTGRIVAPPSALEDLASRTIRTITAHSIGEDPLRALRIVQFASRFGGTIAPETVAQIAATRHLLPTIARERFGEEMHKLLLKSPRPSVGLELLANLDLLQYVDQSVSRNGEHRQGLLAGVGMAQNVYHDLDVFHHQTAATDVAARLVDEGNLMTLSLDLAIDALGGERLARILLYAALTHDIAKPATAVWKDGYGNTFFSHEVVGQGMSHSFMRALGASDEDAQLVAALVRQHMFATRQPAARAAIEATTEELRDDTEAELAHGAVLGPKPIRRFLRNLREESPIALEATWELLYRLRQCDTLGKKHAAHWDPADHNHAFAQAVSAELTYQPPLSITDLAIGGDDLIALFVGEGWEKPGFRGNRAFRDILTTCLDAVTDNPEQNHYDILLPLAREMAAAQYRTSAAQRSR